jgi:nucleoside triphosphate pyrophosphatase
MAQTNPMNIILASASPRRRQLLSEAGYEFAIIPADIDEAAFPAEAVTAAEYAEKLALVKAKNVAERYPDTVVIGADTVVDCDGRIIGKPADARDAERITRMLFSAPHQVITGLAIVRICDDTELVESDGTTVFPRRLSAEQIAEHIKGGSWRDKAGAYAIKEVGDEFIEKIEGSLTNVMGLPMERLESLLARLGSPHTKRGWNGPENH